MIARMNAKVETAMREAMGHVAHAEPDQIEPSLTMLDRDERTDALTYSGLIAGYVAIVACGTDWPTDPSIRRIAHGLATIGTTAERLKLDAEQIYQYLSRVVLGSESLVDVIPDEPMFTRLPIIVAQRAAVVYGPKEISTWEYLDRIEFALEAASALDESVLPAALLRVYQPKPDASGQ